MKQVVLLWILCLPLLGMAAGRADSARLKKGDRCPEFVFQARDSSEVTLRQFRGKYVVIDVWASWCYPCKKEYPTLKVLAKKYKDKGVEFVSISCDASERRWRNEMGFMGAEGHQWWIAGNEDFMKAFEIAAIPRLMLLDPDGKVENLHLPKPSDPKFERILKKMLAKNVKPNK